MRNAAARRLLGRLCGATKQDHAAVSELIARAVELRPDDPVPWLIAGARKIGRGDDDDPWGLRAWYAAGSQAVQDWPVEEFEEILTVSGMEPSWRGSLAPLAAWIEEGYRPDSIAELLASAGAAERAQPQVLGWHGATTSGSVGRGQGGMAGRMKWERPEPEDPGRDFLARKRVHRAASVGGDETQCQPATVIRATGVA